MHQAIFVCALTALIAGILGKGENPCEKYPAGSFIRHPKACDKFFYCSPDGESIEVFCPEEMYFNPYTGICDLPEDVNCVIDADEPTLPPPEEIICPEEDQKSIVFISSKLSCDKYYLCYHGLPLLQECIPELHWNDRLGKCDFPENAKCTITSSLPACPTEGQEIYSHPTECDYFIYCIHGYRSVQQCPFYHHFDVKTKSCVWKNIAHCGSRKNSLNKHNSQ